ncbi:MAG: phosphatidate cytidylyltransferase [Sphingobacteriales bacterium]|nr:phosphatidate cytidylyltransferase [Sphingobacteriales bacterium]
MLLVWSNDTAAYLSGRAFGRHKLFERISPKKTWEGTIGGGLFTLFVGWLLSILFRFSLTTWLGIAALAVLCGTWGDLIESLLKRSLGVKDSGSLLPGHGGVLDRFDALLFVLPFVFAFLYLWGV